MNVDERIIKRLDELIVMGDQVLATKYNLKGVIGDARVNLQMGNQWATSVQSLLARVFGTESEHYKNFTKQIDSRFTYSPAFSAQGVLKAAKQDYEAGYLFEVRQLVEAEMFDDFLEQAEYLLNSNYHHPAAVIAGCVLEDGLRKLCQKNGIAIPERPKLDKMSADLAKVGIISKLTQKRITTLADVRNKAAHGQWNQFDKRDVEEMLPAVRRIMEEHFS